MPRAALGELLVRAAAFILVAELAVGFATLSALAIPTGPLVGGVDTSLSWPLVVVLNIVLVKVTARLDPWRWTPLVAVLLWTGVVLYLGTSRPEGDIIIPADAPGVVFLLLGAAAGGLTLTRELTR